MSKLKDTEFAEVPYKTLLKILLKFTQSRTPKYWISVVEVGQILPTG